MSRALIVLNQPLDYARGARWIKQAPVGTRVEFKAPKRTTPQNDRMWAMLTDIAQQKHHYNIKLSTDDWKLVFLAALKRELRMVPNLDGDGFVQLGGRSSSDLSREEMSDLIELMLEWGARNDIVWSEPKPYSVSTPTPEPSHA